MTAPTRFASVSLLALGALACSAPVLAAQQSSRLSPSIESAVDSIIRAQVLAKGVTGVSLVVARGGEPLLERSYDFSELEAKRAVDARTTYRTGSIAKQFTAALVLKQVDHGRVALHDTIGHFLNGLKPEWTGLTIEQLLNHTSGLSKDFRDPKRIAENMPTDSLLAVARRAEVQTAPAGTKFIYSNTGYMLLGALVERLYSKSYGAAIRDEISRPLVLTSLTSCLDVDATAKSYVRGRNGEVSAAPYMHPTLMLGNGGICTTAADLARWNRALHGGKVLSPASYEAMTTPRGVAARANVPYGFGLYVRDTDGGGKVIVHDGSTLGYNAENVWYPAESLSVTMLYNSSPSLGADLNITEMIGRAVLAAAPR